MSSKSPRTVRRNSEEKRPRPTLSELVREFNNFNLISILSYPDGAQKYAVKISKSKEDLTDEQKREIAWECLTEHGYPGYNPGAKSAHFYEKTVENNNNFSGGQKKQKKRSSSSKKSSSKKRKTTSRK